jgi:hypothetical protein
VAPGVATATALPEFVEKDDVGKRPAERVYVRAVTGSSQNRITVGMLGHDDRDIFRGRSQDVIQVFELRAVADQPVKGKLVRDLQWKQAKPVEPTTQGLGPEWIQRLEGGRHPRAKCRHQGTSIRRQGICQVQSADAPDRRTPMGADMIEIHAERVRVSPEMSALDVQPQRGGPQLGEIIGLPGIADDDVRLEAVDLARHCVGDDTERRLLGIIGLIGGLIQCGGECAENSQSSV